MTPGPPHHTAPDRDAFRRLADEHRHRLQSARTLAIPLAVTLVADQLTPVTAYRRLVAPDQRTAPSFLFESVEGGARQSRYSILGSAPTIHVVARNRQTTVTHRDTAATTTHDNADPLEILRQTDRDIAVPPPRALAPTLRLPDAFTAGWVGFAGYDTVRYAEPDKVPFENAPPDDRALPDLHFAFYPGAVVFDHARKLITVTRLATLRQNTDPDAARDAAAEHIARTVEALRRHTEPMTTAVIRDPTRTPDPHAPAKTSNTPPERFKRAVERAREYIRAGDIFQVVLGQRLEQRSAADPFDVYRALRIVNPSPYMSYLQAEGCILIASSPEILCRVHRNEHNQRVLTNRPLAGTRPRGSTDAEDRRLEHDLRNDAKENAEHIMLLDLARNDVGKVAERASVRIDAAFDIERYSHVMHLSSTVTGTLPDTTDAWNAIRSSLPVGTVSGAPKIRAMQIIDELEPTKRGPYAGGIGYVTPDDTADIALALRTIVVPLDRFDRQTNTWTYHLQAAAGVVYDSDPDAEHNETLNKAAALTAAITLAESAFATTPPPEKAPTQKDAL
jgi:anthranilate synthase component 1